VNQNPVNQTPMNQQGGIRLHRSVNNRMIAGVCGGLAESFGVDPLLVRVVTLFLLIPLHVFLVLLYLALAILLPVEG
jgi:phage shock protein PspC (stress-responsive transcriptional regulator)